MSEIDKYKAQKQKLDNLCDEHSLTASFKHENYPISLSLRPLQGMYEQISMLEQAEDGDGRISQDACLTFYKKDGEIYKQTTGVFTLPDVLENKFKNIFKKMCDFWEQFFFRSVMETNAIRKGLMPVIDEDEADDTEGAAGSEEVQEEAELTEADPDDLDSTLGVNDDMPEEELITAATQLVRMENKCTTALLQRRLKIGYSKAAGLIDVLEQRGIIGPYKGSEPREVLPMDVPESAEEVNDDHDESGAECN